MKPFILTNAAKADLKNIARYTHKKWGEKQRNVYVKQFDDAFHMLSETPMTAKDCNEICTGYKKFPIGSHLIFFKKGTNSSIKIVRILHKRMDVETNFQDP